MLVLLFLLVSGAWNTYAQENWEQVGKTNDFNTFPSGFVNPNGFSAQGYGATGAEKDYCAYKKTPVAGNAVGIAQSLDAQKSYKVAFKLKANAPCVVKMICEGPDETIDISDNISLSKQGGSDPMITYVSNEFTVPVSGSYNLMVAFVSKLNTGDSKLRIDDFELYRKDPSPKEPVLTLTPLFLNFGYAPITGEGETLNFTVTGENLTSPLTVEITGEAFSTSITEISINDAQQTGGYPVPVTFEPIAEQIYSGKITVSGGGIAEPKEIILNGKGFDPTLPPVVIYSEDCGNPQDGNVDIERHIWQNSDLVYEGVGTVRTSLPSQGYTGASGKGCVLLNGSEAGEPWLQISGINTLDYQNIVLSFGTHITQAYGETCPLIVEVSPNGIVWNKLDSLKWWDSTWEYKKLSGKIPGCRNLRIRFTRSPEQSTAQIRLDDIRLSGYPKEENAPLIDGSDLLDFGTVEAGESVQPQLSLIQASDLKGDLSVSYSGDSVFHFDNLSVIPKAEAEAGFRFPVSFDTAAPGTYSGIITITGEGAEPLLIGLQGNVINPTGLPEVFYTENCGSPAATVSLDKNNWQNLNIKYEGTADARSTLPSTGYPNASGNGCVFLNSTDPHENEWFQISQLNTSLYANITLSFGLQKSMKTASGLTVEVSSNGVDWDSLAFESKASTDWNYVKASGRIPSCDNLRIRFTSPAGGQWRLDDIQLTGIKNLFTKPTVLTNQTQIDFNRQETGETATKELVISGYQLTGDLQISLEGDETFGIDNISVIPQVEAENGYVLPVRFMPQAERTYSGTLTISGGGLTGPKTVTLTGEGVTLNVSTIADLRQKNPDKTNVYTLRNEDIIVTFHRGSYIYIQDATAGILVYNINTPITTYLSEGDLIPEIKGTLEVYNGMLELIPTGDVTISGNRSLDDPDPVTIAELTADPGKYESRLVRIDKVQFAQGSFSTTNKALEFTQDGNTMTCYNKFGLLNSFTPPAGEVSVIGFPAPGNQLYPRTENDIFVAQTGIENLQTDTPVIYAFEGTIRVKTDAGEKITVYDLVGQKIAEATAGTEITEITLTGQRLVLVKTGNRTVKISL